MTQVKICGLTNFEDAFVAAAVGADLLGFIFYEPSPRYVAPDVVGEIVARLKQQLDSPPQFVGVFVNAARATIEKIMRECGLNFAQLHGDESPAFMAHFAGRAFKAVNPSSLRDAQEAVQQFILHPPDFILLDAYHPTLRGGTGHTADWQMAQTVAQAHQLLLAGGLTPDNVAEAIRRVQPWGVDVSSGIEATKGQKDHAKVRAFVTAVRTIYDV
jgi:phosphoribosylanthranilate isomerase